MIAVCNNCREMFETTQEDAFTPGVVCPACYRRRQEIQKKAPAHRFSRAGNDPYPYVTAVGAVWNVAQQRFAIRTILRNGPRILRACATAERARGIVAVLLVAFVLLMPAAPVQAGGYTKVCRNIPHGQVCTINGHRYSITCNHGYMVWPRGAGSSCVKARP